MAENRSRRLAAQGVCQVWRARVSWTEIDSAGRWWVTAGDDFDLAMDEVMDEAVGVVDAQRPEAVCFLKQKNPREAGSFGAEGGTRTRTLLRAVDFESTASTNSATSAHASAGSGQRPSRGPRSIRQSHDFL
jgi:hypothetical protein